MADILIIEDDTEVRELIKVHLTHAGHGVREATDGDAGIAMTNEAAPDLIVLDIKMPRMDGVSVMKALRAAPETRDVPVIALSALNQAQMRDDMHGLGCAAYVSKPINIDAFLDHVTRLTA